METNSIYQKLAQSIEVKEIALPIKGVLNPNDQIGSVWDSLMQEGADLDDIYIVSDSQNLFGYLTLQSDCFSGDLTGMAGERADKIKPAQLLHESSPVLDVFELFLREWVYFVETDCHITHYISWPSINSLPSRLCLYILIMEFETEITRVLYYKNFYEFNKFFIETLQSDHLESINRRYTKNLERMSKHKFYHQSNQDDLFSQLDYRKYIPSMTFFEKTEMFKNYPVIIDQLPVRDRNELLSFLDKLVDLRNKFAHGNLIWEGFASPERKPFLSTIQQLKRVVNKLKEIQY